MSDKFLRVHDKNRRCTGWHWGFQQCKAFIRSGVVKYKRIDVLIADLYAVEKWNQEVDVMAMEITSNYNAYESTYAAQKQETAKNQAASGKETPWAWTGRITKRPSIWRHPWSPSGTLISMRKNTGNWPNRYWQRIPCCRKFSGNRLRPVCRGSSRGLRIYLSCI